MRHVILTCRHHPELRWMCKEIAFSDEGGYNGARSIFFKGWSTGRMYSDNSGLDCTIVRVVNGVQEFAQECKCPASDLVRAPEDKLVRES